MNNKELEKVNTGLPVETPAEMSIEFGSGGIRRILIYSGDPDEQAKAHRLIACISSQLYLLDTALKQAEVPPSLS